MKVQPVASTPVPLRGYFSSLRMVSWSGKEDSNLRPLPPESITPRFLWRFPVGSRRKLTAYRGVCSCRVHGGGSIRAEGHCLRLALIVAAVASGMGGYGGK